VVVDGVEIGLGRSDVADDVDALGGVPVARPGDDGDLRIRGNDVVEAAPRSWATFWPRLPVISNTLP
jgi:hypothetical protein